ncbi:putative AAA domain containing protein [Lyophyllum shimeji]|uniref:AAA domain containing protein n=1 Tax=Lyophyllum shimeji TaxID=47721 RepID=A0A9P3PRM6_LYOSH|nr:putative AAA domain containing protein [Lyophyllum shimeji]
MENSFNVNPQIFRPTCHSISVEVWHENALTKTAVQSFWNTVTDGVIGMAPAYGSKCALTTLALSSKSNVLVIRISVSKAGKKTQNQGNRSPGRILLRELLLDQTIVKTAFKMDKLAAALYTDIGLFIANGVDLLSTGKDERQSLSTLMAVLGGERTLNKSKVVKLFEQEEKDSGNTTDIASQAWASHQAALLERTSPVVATSAKINTHVLDEMHLTVLAKIVRDADRLVALKPTRQKNEVEKRHSEKQGKLELTSSRFKTRIMTTHGSNQTIEIRTVGQRGEQRISAKVTNEEKCIWLPAEQVSWFNTSSSTIPIALSFPSPRKLNASQRQAVNTILSNEDAHRIALIHGPPGTGKTTVIAAAVTSIMASRDYDRTIWLVAQSNVAVKNIAEKLVDVGFLGFRLLVSKDFHFDWHEHLYQRIEKTVIRSDDFPQSVVAAERLLLGSRVILCTLSMLSNQKLIFSRFLAPQTVIFDEASQIEVGDYLPFLQRFQSTLRKLVFIGDDKQLAPYGHGDIPELRSIFEMPHLRDGAVFLDTQYRMPVPIGNFISREVYGGRLKSEHPIKAMSSCKFVDVAAGHEEKSGNSWGNLREVSIAVSLARIFNSTGKAYRVITPYDAQRSKLENALKAANLPWEDRCFNVDSFQGNEADYIILSLVRSQKIGFMKDPRRTNVMLTRCKKGMVILTSRKFVEGVASSSLVGGLAKAWGLKASNWIEALSVLNARAAERVHDMPRMPPSRLLNLMQTLVDGAEFSLVRIPTTKVLELDITADTFTAFDHPRPIGLSPGFSSTGKLLALAIADDKQCTIVEFNVRAAPGYGRNRGGRDDKPSLHRNLDDLQQTILCRPAGELFAFDMAPLSMSLWGDAKLRVTNAVDIQSGLSAVDRKPLTAIKEILGKRNARFEGPKVAASFPVLPHLAIKPTATSGSDGYAAEVSTLGSGCPHRPRYLCPSSFEAILAGLEAL